MSDILEKYKIDPYIFLGIDPFSTLEDIKKAYKLKAKKYHPDKNGGKTEVEFKILVLCYKHAKKNFINTPVKEFDELKSDSKTEEDIHYGRTFNNTNFEDTRTRKEIFADDDIDLESFQKEIQRVSGMSTSYVAENFYKKEIIDKMKSKGKFDREKFNAYFLKLKKDGKIHDQQLVKVEKVQPCNSDTNYMRVNIHENMIINIDGNKNDGNYRDLRRTREIRNEDLQEVLDTDLKTIDKLIKENKKDTGKMTRKKLKELQEKAKQPIQVEDTLSFGQMKEKLELEEMQRIRQEKEQQREVVLRNKRIYNNRLEWS